MYVALSSSRVNSSAPLVCRHNQVTREACRPNGKGSGEEGILSDVVPVYLYCPAFSVNVSLGTCVIQVCMLTGRPAAQHTSHRQPRPNLAVHVDRAYRQPTNMQPSTFCITD